MPQMLGRRLNQGRCTIPGIPPTSFRDSENQYLINLTLLFLRLQSELVNLDQTAFLIFPRRRWLTDTEAMGIRTCKFHSYALAVVEGRTRTDAPSNVGTH
ncbi:hypothetical protein B0H17DRAFT_637683 [Mycena rosella]|uniref:Uncharacterized protein n=1 Tax=Mycena rosella TaxID=1033263 RepID=A0AAD7DE27_MYCRO|nr:hypothetical protein B0H17DRAFT_637683 [Mycena rosella]